jgi:hypothetical protein
MVCARLHGSRVTGAELHCEFVSKTVAFCAENRVARNIMRRLGKEAAE